MFDPIGGLRSVVYKITRVSDGNSYIGKTVVGPHKRMLEHIRGSKNPKRREYNTLFQRALRKHGASAFELQTLVVAEPNMLSGIEIALIEKYGTLSPGGFNTSRGGESGFLGLKLSDEHKRKIGASNKGKRNSPDAIAKMVKSKTGKPGTPLTEEGLAKLIAGQHMWRKNNPEAVAEKYRKHSEYMKKLRSSKKNNEERRCA